MQDDLSQAAFFKNLQVGLYFLSVDTFSVHDNFVARGRILVQQVGKSGFLFGFVKVGKLRSPSFPRDTDRTL